MNNKGFAVSGILYTVLLMFLALLSMLLWNLENRKSLLDKIKADVNNLLNEVEYKVYSNGYAIYFNPQTGELCEENEAVSTTGTKTGCMKWYAFNDSKYDDTVNLLLDHNTTARLSWNTVGEYGTNVSYEQSNVKMEIDKLVSESNWKSEFNPRIISAEEISQITEKTDWTNTSGGYCLESKVQDSASSPYCNNSGTFGWLYDHTYCVEGSNDWKCPNNDTATYGYWTSTTYGNAGSGSIVWFVDRIGLLVDDYANNTNYGVRPVITISKDKLIKSDIKKGPSMKLPTSEYSHKGVVYLDPTNLDRYCDENNSVSETETKTGCMKWYIYDNSGDSYKLLLDHNTTARLAWNTVGQYGTNVAYTDSNIKPEVDKLVSESKWKSMPRLITAEEVNKITGKTGWTNTSSWYCLESKVKDSTSSPWCNNTGKLGWLYDHTYCVEGSNDWKCPNNDTATYGYWTSTTYGNAGSGSIVWFVDRIGLLVDDYANNTNYGVRPVITISKDIVKNVDCSAGATFNFDYTGGEQEFTAMCAGSYKMELWGAQGNYGGTDNMPASQAGKGAYTVGTIGLNQNDKLYIYVGENNHSNDYSIENATFNGGGSSISRQNNVGYYGAAGGGATDIRLVNGNWNDNSSLNSRIMVAAGGGSGSSSIKDGSSLSLHSTKGGSGGTLVGENASAIYRGANVSATYLAKGGTQTSGGAIGSYDSRYGIPSVGLFGIGGTSSTPSSANGNYSQGGGGGGWYGGAGGSHYPDTGMSGGAGGSSYISGHAGCVANTSATSSAPKNGCANGTTDIECSKHYSGYIFTDTNMISGNESMPTHDGKSTMIGNYNSGYARITYLG